MTGDEEVKAKCVRSKCVCLVRQVPMQDARAKELSFFRASPHYNGLKNVGTGFLSVKLSNHLISSIRKQLPVITHSINEGIVNLEKELESMGGAQVLLHMRLSVSHGSC